jgi:hypothetical protein
MSNHKTKYKRYGEEYRAECTCKQNSKLGTRQDAEDWIIRHHTEVQRARAHLMGRNPSLANQYGYYRKREADPNISEEDRRLWKQLADELEPRLPSDIHNDATLW